MIVTYNLKDFPCESLQQYNVEIWHPDDFISYFIDMAPGMVCAAIQRLIETLKNPPIEIDLYFETLERQSLPKTVIKLRQLLLTPTNSVTQKTTDKIMV